MTQNPELSVVGRIEAMPELPVVAWITDDGRVATAQTKLVMGSPSKESFNDPLCKVSDALTYASQTLASRDGEIARLRGALEPFANIAYYEELVSAMSATLERYEEQSALIAAFINARAVLVVAPQPTKEQSNG